MTPIRSINYATWAIWGSVTFVAVLNAGWVRISTIEAGGAFPMTLEFFVMPDGFFVAAKCLTIDEGAAIRYLTEMFMVPANMVLIGLALAIPFTGLRTTTAAITLVTVLFTFESSGHWRLHCPITVDYYRLWDLSHLEGLTLFDVISLVPRILYLTLILCTPVNWAPIGLWARQVHGTRGDTSLAHQLRQT